MANDVSSNFSRELIHVFNIIPDPILKFHLKQQSHRIGLDYQSISLTDIAYENFPTSSIVVVDCFCHPVMPLNEWRGINASMSASEAPFIFIFSRKFSLLSKLPTQLNCEYCFLGYDGLQEIGLRIKTAQARAAKLGKAMNLSNANASSCIRGGEFLNHFRV